MKTIQYFILLLIILLCTLSARGASSEADFIKLTKEYTFLPDGSMEFRCYKQLRINTHLALNNLYGETFIVYNPEYQSLQFNNCYTRQADGTIIPMPQNAFNEVLPAFAADAPAYNHLKEMVVTHTGLELGATIYLDYTLTTRPGYFPQPEVDELLQEASPVKEYTVIINIPKDKELSYTLTGKSVRPRVSVKNNRKQYRWTLKNVAAASREYFQARDSRTAPRLTACYNSSPQEILDRYLSFFHSDLTPAHRTLAEQLSQKFTDGKEKIFALQSFVIDQIATIPIPAEFTAFKMRSPGEVIESAYGTEAEKTQLLMALLQTLNYTPELVVIYPASLSHSVKGLKAIKTLMVKIDDKGKPLFLSAVDEATEPLELTGHRHEIWLVSKNNARPLTVIGNRGELNVRGKIGIQPSEALCDLKIDLRGILSQSNRENKEKRAENFAYGFGNFQKKEVSFPSLQGAHLEISTSLPLASTQGYSIFTLPTSSQGIESWRMKYLNSKRLTLLEIPHPWKESYEYEISLAPGLSLATAPTEIHRNTAVGNLDIVIRQNGGKIQIIKSIELNKALIDPSEYDIFRDLMITWFSPVYQNIVLH